MRQLRGVLLLLTTVLLLSSVGGNAQELPTVRVGVLNALGMAPFYLADKLGYFKDEGLNVEFVPFDSVTNMVAPLGRGQLDVGGGALAAGVYNAVARGIDVKVVADLSSDPPGYGFQMLLVRTALLKSGRFKQLHDLKGLTVAGNTPGSTSSSLLNELLKKAGLSLSDVKRVFMSYPDQMVALRNGAVDAVLMPEPTATQAIRSGVAMKVINDDEIYPDQQVSVVVYGANMLQAHRDLGLKFMRAFIRAARFYNGALAGGGYKGRNAATVVRILTEDTSIKDPTIYQAVTPNGINPDGHVRLHSMQLDFDFFKAEGLIEGTISVPQVVDDSFVSDALKELGPYRPSV